VWQLCAKDAGLNIGIFIAFSVDIFVVEELVFVDKWGMKFGQVEVFFILYLRANISISLLPYSRPSTVGSVWAKLLLLSYWSHLSLFLCLSLSFNISLFLVFYLNFLTYDPSLILNEQVTFPVSTEVTQRYTITVLRTFSDNVSTAYVT